jgi:predicted DNA-binding transcriptional regulator YafY
MRRVRSAGQWARLSRPRLRRSFPRSGERVLPPLLLDDDSAVAVAIGLRTVATRGMEEAAARAAAAAVARSVGRALAAGPEPAGLS